MNASEMNCYYFSHQNTLIFHYLSENYRVARLCTRSSWSMRWAASNAPRHDPPNYGHKAPLIPNIPYKYWANRPFNEAARFLLIIDRGAASHAPPYCVVEGVFCRSSTLNEWPEHMTVTRPNLIFDDSRVNVEPIFVCVRNGWLTIFLCCKKWCNVPRKYCTLKWDFYTHQFFNSFPFLFYLRSLRFDNIDILIFNS